MANTDLDNDESAIRRALEGDNAAWTALMEKYRLYLYRMVWRVTLNEDDAMDCIQETFLKVSANLPALKTRSNFRSWITSIAMREALNICRRRATVPTAIEPGMIEEMASHHNSNYHDGKQEMHQMLEQKRRSIQLHSAMESLSPQQRVILILGIGNDIGPAEIARELNLPANQVRSQWSRAVTKIKEILQETVEPVKGK